LVSEQFATSEYPYIATFIHSRIFYSISLVDALGGVEVCDAFDMIAGTSTGAIIAFLVGLRRESSEQARKRYDALIKKIFVKSALSTPMVGYGIFAIVCLMMSLVCLSSNPLISIYSTILSFFSQQPLTTKRHSILL
jgi:patatin-like phospholipase/acyl hydrolase